MKEQEYIKQQEREADKMWAEVAKEEYEAKVRRAHLYKYQQSLEFKRMAEQRWKLQFLMTEHFELYSLYTIMRIIRVTSFSQLLLLFYLTMLFHVDRLYMMKRKGYEQMRP
jgi:hypothetical protein